MSQDTAAMSSTGTTAALLDPNPASREDLTALGLDSAVVAMFLADRPFDDMVILDERLTASMDSELDAPYEGGLAEFRREIGKCVDDAKVERLARYVRVGSGSDG